MTERVYTGRFANITNSKSFSSINLFVCDTCIDLVCQKVTEETEIYQNPVITVIGNVLKFSGTYCELILIKKMQKVDDFELDDIVDGEKLVIYKSTLFGAKTYLPKGYYVKKARQKLSFETTLWKLNFWNYFPI